MGCFSSKSPDPATLPQLLDSLPLQVRLNSETKVVSVFQGSQVLKVFKPQCELDFSTKALQLFHNGTLHFCDVDSDKPSRIGGFDLTSLEATNVVDVGLRLSGGALHVLDDSFVYCGGQIIYPEGTEDKPSPLIKYDIGSNTIDYLEFRPNLKIIASAHSDLDESRPDSEVRGSKKTKAEMLTPNSLIMPGACTDGVGFLYLIGGTYLRETEAKTPVPVVNEGSENAPEREQQRDRKPPTEKVYLGVMQIDTFNNKYRELKATLPAGIQAPYCTMLTDNEILVAGGRAPNKRLKPLVKDCYIIQVRQGDITPVKKLPCKLEMCNTSSSYRRPYLTIYRPPNFVIFNYEVKKWFLMKISPNSLDRALAESVAMKKVEKLRGANFLKSDAAEVKARAVLENSLQSIDIELADEFAVSRSHFIEYFECFLRDFDIKIEDDFKEGLLDQLPKKIKSMTFRKTLLKAVPLQTKFFIDAIETHFESVQEITGCHRYSKKHIRQLMQGKDRHLKWVNSAQGVDVIVKAYQSMRMD